MTVGEFELIAQLLAGLPACGPGVLLGPGDDAAVVHGPDDKVHLYSCDAQVEGRHFKLGVATPHQLGQRLAEVNLSDIAAMGGQPRFALVSLHLSKHVDAVFINEYYQGIRDAFAPFGVALLGGNVAGGVERFGTDMFIVGEANAADVKYRHNAQVGQLVCVTGSLGDSGAGLQLLENPSADLSRFAFLARRYLTPTARVAAGRILAKYPGVGGCIDISDGLLADASHLALASGVDIHLDSDQIPLSAPLMDYCEDQAVALALALEAGEDFELLFTINEDDLERVAAQIESAAGVGVTPIGRVLRCEGNSGCVLVDGHSIEGTTGFDHLR